MWSPASPPPGGRSARRRRPGAGRPTGRARRRPRRRGAGRTRPGHGRARPPCPRRRCPPARSAPPRRPRPRRPAAMRATPVRRGRMVGSSWVVPSGNTATTWSSARARTGGGEHGPVVGGIARADPALHGHGARDVQQQLRRRHRPQRRLGQEPGQAAEHGHQQHRVHEAVQVARRHDHPAARRRRARHLHGPEEGARQQPGQGDDSTVPLPPRATGPCHRPHRGRRPQVPASPGRGAAPAPRSTPDLASLASQWRRERRQIGSTGARHRPAHLGAPPVEVVLADGARAGHAHLGHRRAEAP